VLLEVVIVKEIKSQYHLDYWRIHFKDPPLVT